MATDDKAQLLADLSYSRTGSPGKTSVDDEYQKELRGAQGRRTYAQIGNCSSVSGALLCLKNLYTTTDFHVDPAQGVADPDRAAELAAWAYDALTQGATTWAELTAMAAGALQYGWAYINVTKGKRPDGTIGLGECVEVHPDTLDDWDTDERGRVRGIYQYPPTGRAASVYVPATEALHYVPIYHKGSPEGRSLLRGSYEDWFYLTKLKTFRAILAERMAGFPVVTCNSDIKRLANDPGLSSEQRAAYAQIVSQIEDIPKKVKINQQAGATLWTQPYVNVDADGNRTYTSTMQLKLELLAPAGASTLDYDRAIQYHDTAIARAMLMQFIFMGDVGTSGAQNALSDMNGMFYRSAEAFLASFYSAVQRQILPRLWAWNGYPAEYMPTLRPGRISTESLEQLGRFVAAMAGAGVVLTDPQTEEELRRRAGLPIPDGLSGVL